MRHSAIMVVLFCLIFTNAHAKAARIADPEVVQIHVIENHDSIIDLHQQSKIHFGPSPEIKHNQNYTFMRASVYKRLIKAEGMLPKGLHLCIYEAYRSLDLQNHLFQTHFHHLQKTYPQWSSNKIFHLTTTLVSPVTNPDGSQNIPPHSTGGAIDIYLIDDHNVPLDMGIHPKDWMQDKDGRLSKTKSIYISKKAQHLREILTQVLSAQGFVNYPYEYWHWSYGDRYWAYIKRQPHAVYGPLQSLGSKT